MEIGKESTFVTGSKEELKKKRDPKYPVVFPNGMVKEIPCGKYSKHALGGDTILVYRDNRPTIEPRYQDKGFEFYEKICEKDGEMDKWDLWCDMVKARASGSNVDFPDECFSKTVRHRRDMAAGRSPEASIDFAKRMKEREAQSLESRVTGDMASALDGAKNG